MSAEERTGRTTLDRPLLLRLWQFLRPHRRLLYVGLALLAATFAADLAGPWIVRVTVDGPVRTVLENQGDGRDEAVRVILWWAALFLGVSLVGAALRYAQTVVLVAVGQRVTYDVRNTLFGHLLRLPSRWHDRHRGGELVTRVTSDVESLAELFSSGVATFLFDLVRIVGLLAALLWIDARLASLVLVGLPLFIATSLRFRTRARLAYRDARRSLSAANSFAHESVAGMNVVQLYGQQASMAARFREKGHQLREAWMRTVRQYAVFLPIVDFTNQLLVAATFGWGAWLIVQGELSSGQFLQYWFYLRLIAEPIQQIAERYNVLQSALSSTERIHGILEEEPESGGDHQATVAGAVALRGVTLSYDGRTDALRDVELELAPGETVALVGATGAGKSSLARLLMRLYDASGGEVRVDARLVSDWSLESLRHGIGVVPQEVFLFTDSILENVRLRDPSITPEQVREACETIGAASFIEGLPDGYETALGERGVNLSVGQRQLLAFARVLVRDPAVLVLDEATSSVDSETEWQIQRALETLLEGRTCLIVAHRLSTIRRADRIVVLHKGEIREVGRHQQLIEQDGIYARLHRLQFGAS